MYFPIGWPKSISLSPPGDIANVNHICCDAVKILVAAIGDSFLGLWYANPLLPIAFYRRDQDSVDTYGTNRLIIWKPDSRQLTILTSSGVLLLYCIDFEANGNNVFTLVDPPMSNLRRDSAELFIKENIPQLRLREVGLFQLPSVITVVCCISLTELLIATDRCELIRILWTNLEDKSPEIAGATGAASISNHADSESEEYSPFVCINLREIPFYANRNCYLKNLPPVSEGSYVASLEYSPFIGGCAVVFSDNRAAFLIAQHLRFETKNIHGFWVPDVEDAVVCSVNHKFRLLVYGRKNADIAVYSIEDATGGLEFSHHLSLNSSMMPGTLGAVNELKWSSDGCVLAVSWQRGGFSLWSTFGALLTSSFSWDFGVAVDLMHNNPLQLRKMEWSTEGYQLFMICDNSEASMRSADGFYTSADASSNKSSTGRSNALLLSFVKSSLTMNPCMTSQPHVLLQGDDTLYLNQGDNIEKIYVGSKFSFPNNEPHVYPEAKPNEQTVADGHADDRNNDDNESHELKRSCNISSILSESKYWMILQLPQTYAATNWPIRYSAIDTEGLHLAVAGRTGLAHYSMVSKKWKVFGNESQEKDFVVSGGLIWWKGFIVMGCYSLLDHTDEIRCYPEECKLDNQYGNKIQIRAPVISMNMFQDQLIALTADGVISIFCLEKRDAYKLTVNCSYEVDVKNICVHPACIVSLTVTNLRNDLPSKAVAASTADTSAETIIVNVCGRILMIQRDSRNNVMNSLMASCLASCVECFWISNGVEKGPMSDCLWLYSGAHGMRVWLPILPPAQEQQSDAAQRLHTFMSKRIMLSFPLKLYPLVILFDNVIVLGVENETTLYTNDTSNHFSLPFCMLERKTQVYLHKILRQLIKRNLGYSAWEIAKACRSLPYFPHSLELLLHEVLEEEATTKEPIPDALLPSILDFIREFPVYLQTVVQCARKTEIALWPYLFSVAGKPKDLFQQCLQSEELETAASYLIILQNLEPSLISKQYATLLLDIALQNRKWDLAKDLIRFLKAIDPNEIDSPRSSMVINMKIAPQTQTQSQVSRNPEAFNMILGQITRERSFSTTVLPLPKDIKKDKQPSSVTATATASSVAGSASATNEAVIMSASTSSNTAGASVATRRKSERSNSTKDRKETFCIDGILQHHARDLLRKYKLIDLGYMSAYLDFHLVSWLSQEVDRAAKLDDFVEALSCLHEELNLTATNGLVNGAVLAQKEASTYAQVQKQYQLDAQRQVPPSCTAQSQTSESGYFSLAMLDTPTSAGDTQKMKSISPFSTNGKLMRLGGAHASSSAAAALTGQPAATSSSNIFQAEQLDHDFSKSSSNSQMSIDVAAMCYKRVFNPDSSEMSTVGFGYDSMDSGSNCSGGMINEQDYKILPEKVAIKIRYLLQLFTEADCIDYALVLSILLQDSASIGRIINVVMRSTSITACQRIENALKSLTQWSLEPHCIYQTFMMTLQPHIYLLEQFIATTAKSAKKHSLDGQASLSSFNLNGNISNSNMSSNNANTGSNSNSLVSRKGYNTPEIGNKLADIKEINLIDGSISNVTTNHLTNNAIQNNNNSNSNNNVSNMTSSSNSNWSLDNSSCDNVLNASVGHSKLALGSENKTGNGPVGKNANFNQNSYDDDIDYGLDSESNSKCRIM